MATSKTIPIALLVLRILTLAACVGSGVFLVVSISFQDINTLRFVVAAAGLGAAYSIIQLPFIGYYVFTKKRLIRNKCMPSFDFFADKIVSLVLAAAVGAGFAVGFELKKAFKLLLDLVAVLSGVLEASDLGDGVSFQLDAGEKDLTNDFFNRAIIATAILLIGAITMAVVSILTSITRTSNSGFFG